MKYIDAGYATSLSALAGYAVALVGRRRRLEKALALSEADGPAGAGEGAGVPTTEPGR